MRKKRLQRGAQVKLFIVLTLSATTIKNVVLRSPNYCAAILKISLIF